MTYFRAMNDGQKYAAYSLHEINEEWDAGAVIDIQPQLLDLQEAMLTNYCNMASSGVPTIMENLNKMRAGEPISHIPQDPEKVGYHTFPTREEIDSFLDKGLRLVDAQAMKEIYLEKFSQNGTDHYAALAQYIDHIILANLNIHLARTSGQPEAYDQFNISTL